MAKRSVFKNIVFPTPSDDEGYRPVGARPIASRQDDGDAEFIRPASRTYDLSGRYAPLPVEQFDDNEVRDALEADTARPENQFRLYSGEVAERHTGLQPFLESDDAGYIGGDERTYRPALVEAESGNPGGYHFNQRDNTQVPTRIGPNFVLPSMTGMAPATRMENFRVAKAKDALPEGTFSDAVLGRHGDQADSFLG